MALIHLDVLTPKQVMLMEKVKGQLEKEGSNVLLTTRRYREVNELLALKRLEALEVGAHGGGELRSKAEASLNRSLLMLDLLAKERPRVSASFCSPEAVRASFGLAIPHVCISDSPHARAVSLLTVPLSAKLLTPWVIPKAHWVRLGARVGDIIHYNALDPAAWLKEFKPDDSIVDALGLSRTLPIVTVRLEESQAAYLMDQSNRGRGLVDALLRRVVKLHGERAQVVLLPRYDEAAALKRAYGGDVVVAEKIVDGPSLLHESAVFLGGGGTMTAEAALLGVPTFSYYPGSPTLVDRFLMARGLMKRVRSVDMLMREVDRVLDNPRAARRGQERRSRKLLGRMENPVDKIVETILSFC